MRPDDRSRIVDMHPGPGALGGSGNLLQGRATKSVNPRYPSHARESRVTGTVVVEVLVDRRGKVERATAISGPRELRRAAEDAARKWEFRPTLLLGEPVRVIGTITFNFLL